MPSTKNVLDEARQLVQNRLAELDEERKRLERALAELGGKVAKRAGRPKGSSNDQIAPAAAPPPPVGANAVAAPAPTRP